MGVIRGNKKKATPNKKLENTPYSVHFTMSDVQHEKLTALKERHSIKIANFIRMGILFAFNNQKKLKKLNDVDFFFYKAKNYRVDLSENDYEQLNNLSTSLKLSKSRIIRIGINELLKHIYEEEIKDEQ